MDSVSKATLETIGSAGFTVHMSAKTLTAIDQQTGERYIVRFDADHFYDAVVKLAQQVGIDLDEWGGRMSPRRKRT